MPSAVSRRTSRAGCVLGRSPPSVSGDVDKWTRPWGVFGTIHCKRAAMRPRIPRLSCLGARESQLQVALHIAPLGGHDAVHDAVAHRAVAPLVVMPQHAVLLRAERLDGALRPE